MNFQLIFVLLCILAAIIFMGRKVLRTLGGRPQCECGTCGSDKACQGCPGASPNPSTSLKELRPGKR